MSTNENEQRCLYNYTIQQMFETIGHHLKSLSLENKIGGISDYDYYDQYIMSNIRYILQTTPHIPEKQKFKEWFSVFIKPADYMISLSTKNIIIKLINQMLTNKNDYENKNIIELKLVLLKKLTPILLEWRTNPELLKNEIKMFNTTIEKINIQYDNNISLVYFMNILHYN